MIHAANIGDLLNLIHVNLNIVNLNRTKLGDSNTNKESRG